MKITRRQLNQIISESLELTQALNEFELKVGGRIRKFRDEREFEKVVAADEEAKKEEEKAEAEAKKIDAELAEDEDFDLTPFVGKTFISRKKVSAYHFEAVDKIVKMIAGSSVLYTPKSPKWKEKLQLMSFITKPDGLYTEVESADKAYQMIMGRNSPDEANKESDDKKYEEGKEYVFKKGSNYTYIIKDGKWFTHNKSSKKITGMDKFSGPGQALEKINNKFIKDGVLTKALPGGDKSYQKKHNSVEDFMAEKNITESLSRGSLYQLRYRRRRY